MALHYTDNKKLSFQQYVAARQSGYSHEQIARGLSSPVFKENSLGAYDASPDQNQKQEISPGAIQMAIDRIIDEAGTAQKYNFSGFPSPASNSGRHGRQVRYGTGAAKVERGREVFLTEDALREKHARDAYEYADALLSMDKTADEAWERYLHNSGQIDYGTYLDDPRLDRSDIEQYLEARKAWEAAVNAYHAGLITFDEFQEKVGAASDIMESFVEKYSYLEEPDEPLSDLKLVDSHGKPVFNNWGLF